MEVRYKLDDIRSKGGIHACTAQTKEPHLYDGRLIPYEIPGSPGVASPSK